MKLLKLLVLLCALVVSTNAHAIDAVITFTDNATDETGFPIQRNLNGSVYTDLVTAPASAGAGSIVQVTDTTLVQSQTIANKYCYRVRAINSAGSSAWANTATQDVSNCKTVPIGTPAVVIPAAPSFTLVK